MSRRDLTDRGAVVLAGAAAAGAMAAVALPLIPAAVVAVGGLLRRRRLLLIIGVALLTSSLGARAWAGLDPPPSTDFDGWAVLVNDPEPVGSGFRVILRADNVRFDATAYANATGRLRNRLAGEEVLVTGHVTGRAITASWQAPRRVTARLAVDAVTDWRPGTRLHDAANRLRRTLMSGTDSLSADHESLLAGLVLGDDRFQSDEVADNFRAAGLTHLLAVSGQNVAFVLTLVQPLIERLGYRGRWVATLAVLGFFALLTRFEPSVLRATVMAALATTTRMLGRDASPLRLLSFAVTVILIADPLLVHALAFRLSVAASLGIVIGAGRIAERIPGPRLLGAAVGVTLSAQLAVAPLLIATFGRVPLVSLPANLLAGPIAGPAMMWGMTAGPLAGVLGGTWAWLLHRPTAAMLWWLESVAEVAAETPLGTLGWPQLVIAAAVTYGWLRR